MILKSIILGIVEGLTEFLPVSSTGHLILVNQLVSFQNKSFETMFDVFIQSGAIIAVIIYFWDKIFPKFNDRKQTKKVFNLWVKVIIAFLPAAVFGVLFDDKIEEHFFNPTTVAIALIFGALLLLIAEKKLKRVKAETTEDIKVGGALGVGIFQCLALWPGMSRSASTIIGGLFMGLSREASAEFSFFLAIPTIIGASVFKLLKAIIKTGLSFSSMEWIALLVGTGVSFIVAFFVVAFFMNYIKKRKLAPFAYYRIILGILVLLIL